VGVLTVEDPFKCLDLDGISYIQEKTNICAFSHHLIKTIQQKVQKMWAKFSFYVKSFKLRAPQN